MKLCFSGRFLSLLEWLQFLDEIVMRIVLRAQFAALLARPYNSMEQSPSQANSRSASQKVWHRLWNASVYYRVNKSLSMVPTLSQFNL
jgi:hypothetical protein